MAGFIRINNRNNFLLKEIPKYHPQSAAYLQFWKTQKKRCIEGYWSIDEKDFIVDTSKSEIVKEGGYRFMPGNLYFYVNFGTILHKEEDAPKSAPKKLIKPLLRDIEWELFYNWLEARGFSGFEGDDEYTCNRDIFLLEDKAELILHKSCYNSKGELKKYIPARQYLRQLHNKPLGIPLYENDALNLMMMGSRGFGKSYSVGIGIILHEFLFDGAKRYDEESIKNPYKVEIFVGAALSSKSSDLLDKTKTALNRLPGAWAENTEDYSPPPFYKQTSGVLSPNNMKNPWRHEYERKMGGEWKTVGTGSNIKHGIYSIENPEAAAGTRPGVMVIEEVGLLPNVLQVHGSNTACMLEGTTKFGSAIYLGTGGNVEKAEESEIIFRDPKGFDFVEFEDEWEGTGKVGWFVPAIYALNQFKDSNGNTDVEEATKFLNDRRTKKRKSKDSSALSLEMMNYPQVPSEMFLNAKGSMFPQAELKSHLADIKANPHKYENAHYYGNLVWNNKGELEWEHGNQNEVVRDWPILDNKDKLGIIEIFEMPHKDIHDQVQSNRYIQGTDTYDDDESSTNSLGSTFVFDLWTSRVVAEYTGRRGTKEFYEITRKLSIFYKTIHNYEQNKKGLYMYYEQKKSLHLLADTPESLKDIADITISKIGNKAKGTTTSTPIIAHGLRMILDWLLEPAYGEDNPEILNLHKIRSRGLLNELIHYNPKGNFDRVSAMIMVIIMKEHLYKFTEESQTKKIKALADDDFFKRSYIRKSGKNNRMQFNTFLKN